MPMQKCDQCGNEYDKPMRVSIGGKDLTFDCFECAITMLAPVCSHCGCKVIGHGVESGAAVYCCAHCAREAGEKGISDRAGHAAE